MQPNQQVTFLTDGGDDIRDLPRSVPIEPRPSTDSNRYRPANRRAPGTGPGSALMLGAARDGPPTAAGSSGDGRGAGAGTG